MDLFNSTEALTDVQTGEQHALFDLATSMGKYLSDENVEMLYRLAKTNLRNKDVVIQKKAYKGIAALLECGRYSDTIGKSKEDLQFLLLDSNLSASSPSKKVYILFFLSSLLFFLLLLVTKLSTNQT